VTLGFEVRAVYLDPPFNSNATYNVLFKSPTGQQSEAQIEAFEDTWHLNIHAEEAFDEVMKSGNTNAAEMLRAVRGFLGENDIMAYLALMAVRLIELHRVLKPMGSRTLTRTPVDLTWTGERDLPPNRRPPPFPPLGSHRALPAHRRALPVPLPLCRVDCLGLDRCGEILPGAL
jgi:hypothetical protein